MLPFNYLVPALYMNATIKSLTNLGNLTTGGALNLGQLISGTIRSEPGFEPNFTAKVIFGADFIAIDAVGKASRPDFTGLVVPDNGGAPFQVHATGIQVATKEVLEIIATNSTAGLAVPYGATYSVWLPTFRGGSKEFVNLQDSIFVGSESVSTGPKPGEFILGLKISKVFSTATNITIGNEYP